MVRGWVTADWRPCTATNDAHCTAPWGEGEGGVTALTDILLLCQYITSDTSDGSDEMY